MAYLFNHRHFYEGLKEGKLLGLVCKSCGKYTVPAKICCAECGSTEIEAVQLSGKGKIKTYTVIRVAPEGFTPPYILAMVELEEGPWLMGNVEGCGTELSDAELIEKNVILGHKVHPPAVYSAGEAVSIAFFLE